MTSAPEEGTLVLADISGYTSYMAGTEHEHSIEILRELIETIATSFDGRLRIDQLEGDALCATTQRTDPQIVTWLEETFARYHRRLRDIRELTTCPCRACASVGGLGLKFIAHRGMFSRQRIGQAIQLYGTDVNLVHRLAKNTVPLREYLFATAALLGGWPAAARAGFVSAPQTYDVGVVEAAYRDLGSVRDAALRDRVVEVRPQDARRTYRFRYRTTPDRLWRVLMDPESQRRSLGVPRVDLVPGAKGTLLGAEYHCRHGKDLQGRSVFRVTGCAAPEFVTMYMDFPLLGHIYRTDRLRDEDGVTVNEVRVTWERPRGITRPFRERAAMLMMDRFFGQAARSIETILDEETAGRASA
ncbi:MAG TPA: DUF2652 domain-containing protein [Candidatus Limnocylindria bacterium]|nr:DUF2652 domain-containing protein [Candidatus Limnocylindria bacterium]